MKEFYPYTIVPQKVDKIRQEGIPTPTLPKLLPIPEKAKRKYLGTIIFIASAAAFITINLMDSKSNLGWFILLFFVALISLVAMIFEFVQYGKLKKQFLQDMKLYHEHKETYLKLKTKLEKIEKDNKEPKLVGQYRQREITNFFKSSYDIIIAVHNEYSQAKKRFKLFLEEYFPDEVLDNVKVVHETKNLDYVPDFIIKFEKPKLNVAIEIEEPYTLSNIPENIQKDYEAKDRIRQRFANELGWIVIVLSEEQAVVSPTQCCKFIEESIELIFDNIKSGDQFVNIKPIKKQKMLTGEERANLKNSRYREKYLIEAGLMDEPADFHLHDHKKAEKVAKVETEKTKEFVEELNVKANKKDETIVENKDNEIVKSELGNTMDEKSTKEEKKKEIENEQMQLIKKIAEKIKPENEEKDEKTIEYEPVKSIKDDTLPTDKEIVSRKEEEKLEEAQSKHKDSQESKTGNGKQLRREEDILNDLYLALDKHSRKQQERKEKRLREVHKKADQKTTNEVVNEHKEQIEKKVEKDNEKIENVEKKVEKDIEEIENVEKKVEQVAEKKEKSAAEIILERKRELEKSMALSKAEENEINEISDTSKEERKTEITTVPEKEESKKKIEEIADINKEEKNQEEHVESKTEEIIESKKEIKETEKEEEILITESKLKSEAKKNQELIDAYREKIEGAVFDKQWDELLTICDEAIEEIPYWDWAYYRRSTAWGAKREFTKVILDCNKAIGFNPTLADAYYNRGTARFFLGKYIEASDDYQKSIDLNFVKKADAYFNRGLCFQKLDHQKKAYREFLKAKEMGSQKAIELIKANYQS